jgi:hypothetical protein
MKETVRISNGILYLTSSQTKLSFWDISSFRPDPREYLTEGRVYSAVIEFESENLCSGEKITIPRKIKTQSRVFVNVR